MFDPISITATIAAANTAFNGIKRAFQIGKDIQSMTGDLSKWMTAASDIENAAKQAKNPTLLQKLVKRGSIEQEALEAFSAKKQLEEQRYELQQFIKFTHGTHAWTELLKMEGEIRKRRQKEVYDRKILRDKIIMWVAVTTVVGIGLVILVGFIYSLQQYDRGNWG
tara:strand:- start:45 stop:542 length:498 start_codon:yes stop_codon:yes gene_type:complete